MCPQVAAIVLVIQRCPNVGEGDIFEHIFDYIFKMAVVMVSMLYVNLGPPAEI